MLYAIQTRLIFAGSATQGTPAAAVRPPAGCELVKLRAAGGGTVVALFGPALGADGRALADAAGRPTLLFFYGNGTCLADSTWLFDRFRRLGANVLIPDYLGYGLSGGSPGESECYATADAAYDHLLGRKDVDATKLVAAGWSLGGGVAVDLAARRKVAGLAVFSTFTGMTEMARRQYPFVPVGLLLKHRFESLKKLPRVTCPVLIGHGAADTLIPPEMATRLAAAAGGPVTRFEVPGAGHNDVMDADTVFARVRAFVDGLH